MNQLEHYRKFESADAEKVSDALWMLNKGDFATAETLLREVVRNAPREYLSSFEDETTEYRKFWDKDEQQYFVNRRSDASSGRELVWLACAYPRAYFYLGMLKMNAKQYQEALPFFEKGLHLEPVHPRLLAEKARAHGMLGEPQVSISCYEKVLEQADVVMPPLRAASLRGKGVQLIELGRMDEAESFLRESLRFDPYNEVAHAELAFIEMKRAEDTTQG